MERFPALHRILRAWAGWYRGDFHAHTLCSDGGLSPLQLVAAAQAAGLDFLALTDHNTLAAFAELDEAVGLCVIPGLEATFDEGHFNLFGFSDMLPWMRPICTGTPSLPQSKSVSPAALLSQASSTGLLTSINHPFLAPWAWRDNRSDLTHVGCLEIWNDPGWLDNQSANQRAVAFWTQLLNAGHRIVAIGGSDYHAVASQPGTRLAPEQLGEPATFVCARELSAAAILQGVRRGQVFITIGPRLSFAARFSDMIVGIGDDLGPVSGPLQLTLSVNDLAVQALARIVQNGVIIAELPLSAPATRHTVSTAVAGEQPIWYRCEVCLPDGTLLAISNPIYAGRWTNPVRRRWGDLAAEFLA